MSAKVPNGPQAPSPSQDAPPGVAAWVAVVAIILAVPPAWLARRRVRRLRKGAA